MSKVIQKKYFTFRSKVLVVLLSIGIVPLLIISLVSLATIIRTRLRNISELQLRTLNVASEKVKGHLYEKMSVFNLVIDLEPDNVSKISVNNLRFIAQGLKEAAGDVKEISFIDKLGKEVVVESEVRGGKSFVLKDVNQKEGFKTAISGEDYIGPVYYTLSGPVVHIASQIENKNRQIIGVIYAEVGLGSIEEEISQLKTGEEGFVYLVDRKGNLITSSNKDFASQGENLRHILLVADVLRGQTHSGLSGGDRYKNALGQEVIFSGIPLAMSGWSVISEWPRDDAFSVVEVVIKQFLVILFVSLVLIIIFSLLLARLVVKPIEKLSRGAREISKGNFDHKINIKTGDELERLGERFNEMQKILKTNQRLRDEFVFIAAHELRAPVTVIRGYISMILGGDAGPVSPELKKFLSPVEQSGYGLNQLVEDLLQVARSEAGRLEIKVGPVDAVEQAKNVLQELKILSDKKKIKLVHNIQPNLPKVMADSGKLQEVIKNLVNNSIKYTLGEGTITVGYEIKESMLIIHVKDTGIGMSKEDQKKLFQKFYRVKATETEKVQGTGLGLWIVKQILERMKGKIWLISEKGKGSTFSFSLPIASNSKAFEKQNVVVK